MSGGARVAVVGATGFVGRSVCEALEQRGHQPVAVRAPRLSSSARDAAGLAAELGRTDVASELTRLREAFATCHAVVNAAGLATATGGAHDALIGANALTPEVVAEAVPTGRRLVHVSSAAVQGRRPVLDESRECSPFSPYSESKRLGEQVMHRRGPDAVCFRPTSVHGPGRRVTRSLVRLLGSPAASVAGRGDRPTPQVLVGNVADAVAFVATTDEEVPGVVLQPWGGLTTSGLVRLLGDRDPRHVPTGVARAIVGAAYAGGKGVERSAGVARRLEMLWFGQQQTQGWLANRWSPVDGEQAWRELR